MVPHADDWYRARLALPRPNPRVVIDTDAANEIDDQFALAWALLSPQRLRVEAVYAAPFSFAHRRAELIRAAAARADPSRATAADLALLQRHGAALAHFDRRGWDVRTIDLPPFNAPEVGMERSFREIVTVFDKLGLSSAGRVFRGSAGYLRTPRAPVHSDAARHLAETALASPADDPLYVVAIGCVTNIASALLIAPEIAERIVVVWTAGYPSHAPHVNDAFNLEQDLIASTLLFDCGVPLVYLPGFHVGAQLRLSIEEAERHVRGRGAIGDYLYHLYTHNPLWDMLGIDSFHAHSWVLWDLIDIAWLLEPAWVPSELVRAPRLTRTRRWRRGGGGRHLMREAHAVARDAIFRDLYDKLQAQAANAASSADSSAQTRSTTPRDR
jgi:inosine-uridine nucleoside N-ribohydrolase